MFTEEQQKLIQEPVFGFFHQICQIPRPSFHEERISAFLTSWAKEQGFDVEQDAAMNVLIRKPASPGYEDAPGIMLQAHMDMVCEKAPNVPHDFSRDPISWQIEGDWVTTGGRTTLGADNGIGMALAMAVLTDERLSHPALEVLFTTAEEEDLSGALHFDMNRVKARRLINLDHACDQEVLCGSCGGQAAELDIPMDAQETPEGWRAYRLSVSGLLGGHSGEDIHRGHGNAIVFLARLIDALDANGPVRLGAVKGGTYRLAIPREASAVVVFPSARASSFTELVHDQRAMLASELSATGESLEVQWEPAEAPTLCYDPTKFLDAVFLSPDGIAQMNETLVGLVDASDNLGELTLSQGELRLVFEIRAARASMGDYLYRKMTRLTGLLGGTGETGKSYPSWHFVPQSPLRTLAVDTYHELFSDEVKCLTVHAGLEVGFFCEKQPELDAIAIGPNCVQFHSPAEAMSIASVRKVYRWLCAVIEKSNTVASES